MLQHLRAVRACFGSAEGVGSRFSCRPADVLEVDKTVAADRKNDSRPLWVAAIAALRQYLIYEEALRRDEPERTLYLAVPEAIYRTFFAEDIIRTLIQRYGLKLLVFDPEPETIALWTN